MNQQSLVDIIAEEIAAKLKESAQTGKKPAESTPVRKVDVPQAMYKAAEQKPVAHACSDTPRAGKQLPEDERARLIERMQATTTARVGVGKAGARMRTETVLKFRADHAVARDSVRREVEPALLEKMGLFSVQTLCRDVDEYLTRPDLGRRFSEEAAQQIVKSCKQNVDVEIFAAGGLSSSAVQANLENILPAINDGLAAKGISVGTPFYVRFSRVGAMDAVSELLHAKVTCVLIGERPGLATAESMSAYICYEARVGMPESRRTVVSNIHKNGIPAAEAGAYIADVIEKILQQKASGVELRKE